MRILTFLHSFEPGGVERVALRLVRAWRSEGVDAPLLMGRSDGAMRAEMATDLTYDVPRQPPFPIGWIETLWMIAILPRRIIRVQPDVLFCAGNSYTIVAMAVKLLLGRRCPPIVAKISNDLERRDMIPPVRWLYRHWLRLHGHFIDHFVGMEAPMAAEIGEAIPSAVGRISIVADPALDDAQIMRLRHALKGRDVRTAGLHFVAIGRLAAQKNVGLMLRAFARGAAEWDRLTIYGDGPERKMLTVLAQKLDIGHQVTFAGHVPDPASHLPDFDIFLLSSDYEGVPAVLLEALAANLPIIATRCSASMATLTSNGTLAHLVEPGDVERFSAAIRDAGQLKQDRAESLTQARRFTIERSSRAYLACFQSVRRTSAPKNIFVPLD
jgi:glycosyltransferase involved in cell wall biosynthesis